MTRALLLLLALLFATPAPAAKKAALPPPTPALWTLADADTRVTLFGTVHSLPRGINWFRPHVVQALDSADVLVMETLIPESPAAMMPSIMRLARLSTPRPVIERVPEIHRGTLQKELDRLKPGVLDWYETWFIALTLGNLESSANGMDPGLGVEAVLAERAKLRPTPIEALETADQQLIYFDALSEADQQQLLISALEDMKSSKPDMEGLIADWMAGNIDGLATRMNADFTRSPMLKQMLIDDRNARWAAWIASEMKKRPGHLFIAVGAGHMAGEDSLIVKLKALGLEVKRVTTMPARKKPPRTR